MIFSGSRQRNELHHITSGITSDIPAMQLYVQQFFQANNT